MSEKEIQPGDEYQAIMVRTDIKGFEDLIGNIEPSFSIAKGAYATELSLMTGKPETFYKITGNGEPETFCLAINRKNVVLGFVMLEYDIRTKTLWISHVYVRPEARHQGVRHCHQ